ncbi:MAG TPA: hypothetical protein VMP08_19750 [Anaerolineae bacterium]|nr:hypothetical protein [Anaerolineae bacterium]
MNTLNNGRGWADGLPGAIGLLICLLLSACASAPTAIPATVTPVPTIVPTFTAIPVPDPFCQNDFVVADGDGGLMCRPTRLPYRFIGINVRELAYLADQNPALNRSDVYRVDLTGANPGIIQRQLETASQMGAKVVRIFAPRFYDVNSSIHSLDDVIAADDRLLAVSSLLEEHHRIQPLKYLIVFTDFYAAPPSFNVYNLHCPGYSANDFSDPFCYLKVGEPPHLRPEWFSHDYAQPTFGEGSYRQYVARLIEHYNSVVTIPLSENDPQGIHVIGSAVTSTQIDPMQIMAWELGNELKVDQPEEAVPVMQQFVQDMACLIHQTDRYPRLVSSGFVSTFHATNGQGHDPAVLYDLRCADGRAALDLGTIHVYNNQWWLPRAVVVPHNERNFSDRLDQYVDYRWFAAQKRPYIVEELGFTGGYHEVAGQHCIDGSYSSGDTIWSGDATRGDGSGQDTLLPRTDITRGPAVAAALDRFFELKASGVMPWAFQAGTADLMMHDACRGLDPLYHTDWNDLFKAYCQKARQLDQRPLTCALTDYQSQTP